ncbi:hypothetical protein OY671_007510 [Metschnikowia pulcherrima]|nr:hypothetical protein OY671_007510 [Metschnikowia pulcherrima]
MTLTLYGIPNCDTVKKARVWSETRGIAYTFHDYKKQGADPARIAGWVAQAGSDKVLNKAGTTFRKSDDAAKADLDADKAVASMVEHTSTIKRPIRRAPVNPVEASAAVSGSINIASSVRRSVWNFPAAMAMVTATAFVSFRARLYGETGSQAFFFVVNGWGWWSWSRAKGGEEAGVPVGWSSARQRIAWAGVTAALSSSSGWAMHRFTNAASPFADSAVTGASIAAQFSSSFRRIENWVSWIAIDVVSIALYSARGLPSSAASYGAFSVMSAVGSRVWIGAARRPAGNEVFA